MKASNWLCLFLLPTPTIAFLANRPHTCCPSRVFFSTCGSSLTSIGSHFQRRQLMKSAAGGEPTLMDVMSQAVAKSLGREEVVLEPSRGGGAPGGGGASVSAAVDAISKEKYFIKTAPVARGGGKMLRAEYLGVKEMSETDTIKTPKPIAYGEGGPLNSAFVVFKYLDMGGRGSGFEMGVQLAKMHRCTSADGFGFHIDNTCGATPQPNLPFQQDWAEFWDSNRLGHMLKLTNNVGLNDKTIQELREKTKQLLSHKPEPSLLHGDLWGGNAGYCKGGDGKAIPVIFDPATYYGDREADIAMTDLFGGFGADFYKGYNSEWPLPEGHEDRVTVYNLYHILNHCVLFGGGYCSQAKGMIQEILRM